MQRVGPTVNISLACMMSANWLSYVHRAHGHTCLHLALKRMTCSLQWTNPEELYGIGKCECALGHLDCCALPTSMVHTVCQHGHRAADSLHAVRRWRGCVLHVLPRGLAPCAAKGQGPAQVRPILFCALGVLGSCKHELHVLALTPGHQVMHMLSVGISCGWRRQTGRGRA
jgi:hypothetical protein